MAACRRQKIGAVRLLIKRGARLDLVDRSRFSALRWAATFGDAPLVRLLLKHKVSVTSDCYTANSALEIAMAQPTKRHAKIVLLLQRQLGKCVCPSGLRQSLDVRADGDCSANAVMNGSRGAATATEGRDLAKGERGD